MKRLMFVLVAIAGVACSDVAAPKAHPQVRKLDECRSGYIITLGKRECADSL